jgi:hypothetical protein
MTKKDIQTIFAGLIMAGAMAVLPYPASAQPGADNSVQIAPASAPEPNDISSATSADSQTSVFVGGTSIMRVRFAAGGYTPHQRAIAIQNRVNKLLGQGPIVPEDITVQGIDNTDAGVYVKGQLLFTADFATAQFNQTSAHELASEWAATMRRVLPELTRPA